MAGTLGTIRGQISLDVRQAIASYVAVRAANATTTYALRRSSDAFIVSGAAMGAAGLALAAAFGLAVKAAADFEKQLDFFGAVSNATEADMERVRAKAIQLGQDTRYSAGEIADSFVELGKAGISAKQIVDGVGEAVANLGAAADIPLERAAQIITAAVQTFELKAQDATHVADLLAGAANASIVEIEDLGVSLKYVGGVAASISLPIEDVIDALALLGKYGIRGSTAGTSLRQILVSLSGTSKKASGVLKELGIITADGSNKFFDAQGKAKPLADIFQVLQDHTEGLTEAQRLAAFKVIFNNRALAAANVLAREGAKGFATMNGEIGKTTAAEVAAKRLDNLSGDVEILKGNIETLLIEAGTPFQEFLRGIVQGATKLVQWFTNLDRETQTLIMKFIAISAVVLLAMAAISTTIGIVLRFVDTVIRLAQAAAFVGKIIKIVAFNLRMLFALFFANPIGIIILALVALAAAFVLLYKKNEKFRNWVNSTAREIVREWNTMVNWFKGLPAFFSNLWNTIKTRTTSVWNAIVNFFTVTIPNYFSNAWNTITTRLGAFVTAFVGFWTSLPGRIQGLVTQLVNGVIQWFQLLPYRLGFIIGFTVGTIIRLFIQLHDRVVSTVIRLSYAVVSWFQALPGRVLTFVTNMINRAIFLFALWRGRSTRLAADLYNGVVNWFRALPGRVQSFVTNLVNNTIRWFVNMYARVRSTVANLYHAVVNWFRALPGAVLAWIISMVNQAVTRFNSMSVHAREMAASVIQAITNGLASLPGVVNSAIDAAISAFRDMVGRAFNAAREFAGGLWDGFKKGLGINSPSFIEKQMVQITKVIGEETGTMRGQIRAVQTLGNRLTKIPTMEPTEQTLVTGYARSLLNNLDTQYRNLKELEGSIQRMSGDSARLTYRENDLALSTAAQRPNEMGPINVAPPDIEFPTTLVLQVGDREFTAYVKDTARGVNKELGSEIYAGRKI